MVDHEAELIRRVREHDDRQAFAQLVRTHQSRLRYSLRQLTGFDDALADDLAQETFIKAYRHLGKFRGDSAFFTWLYRIAWRCFADHCRRRKPEHPTDVGAMPDPGYGTSERDSLHADFARALLQFGPEQRMALHLHLQRGFTHAEIAAIMDRPLGTIKSHITRGRVKLQEYLEAWQT
jgi:RNA polymerase sigma-70 factor (ECF subfamily)